MKGRAQNLLDQLVGVLVFGEVRAKQFGVAENDREDVVEIVRDAAGELTDGFHLLRSEKRLARLLERGLRFTQLGHVVRNAEEAERLAVAIAVDTLCDQIRLRAALAGRDTLEDVRRAGREHLPIVLDEMARRFVGIELEIVLTDDLLRRLPEKPRRGFVHEHVPPVEIFDEDRVGRRLDDRLQNLKAVRNRLRGHPCSLAKRRASGGGATSSGATRAAPSCSTGSRRPSGRNALRCAR